MQYNFREILKRILDHGARLKDIEKRRKDTKLKEYSLFRTKLKHKEHIGRRL
jgi:hypothetical protein